MFVPRTPGHSRRRRTNAFAPINGILSGMLQATADSILQPVILLAAVAFLLNGSTYHIAAFAVIAYLSWTVSAVILTALPVSVHAYPIMIVAVGARLLAVALLALAAFRSPHWEPEDVVGVLLIGFLLYQVASAIIGNLSVGILVGVPPTAKRSTVFQRRGVAGAAMAVIGGTVVWSAFRAAGDVRSALGVLFVLAALATAGATWFLLAVPGSGNQNRNRVNDSELAVLDRVFTPLQSIAYRRFLLFRIALGLAAAADPFLIVFGFREVGLEARDIGLAIVAFAIGHLAGLLLWPRWSTRRGSREPLQFAALLRVIALVSAIGIPPVLTSTLYADLFQSPDVAVRLFLVQFALIGLAVSAQATTYLRYLFDHVAPGSMRQAVATINVGHGILTLAPFAAAYLIDRTSLATMLWCAAVAAFAALLFSGFLIESRLFIAHRTDPRRRQAGLVAPGPEQ